MAASNDEVLVNVVEAGRKGGKARAANMTARERKAAAKMAVEARWEKWRAAHPDRGATKKKPPRKKSAKKSAK